MSDLGFPDFVKSQNTQSRSRTFFGHELRYEKETSSKSRHVNAYMLNIELWFRSDDKWIWCRITSTPGGKLIHNFIHTTSSGYTQAYHTKTTHCESVQPLYLLSINLYLVQMNRVGSDRSFFFLTHILFISYGENCRSKIFSPLFCVIVLTITLMEFWRFK